MKEINYDNIRKGYYISRNGEIYSSLSKKLLSGNIDTYGYKRVKLRRDGEPKEKTYKVHRLVLLTFNPTEDSKELTVNHIDGNKLNNNINNLEWCTVEENVKKAYETGLIYKSRKKISIEEAKEICSWLAKGYSPIMVAQLLYSEDIERKASTVREIANRREWKDVSCNYTFFRKYPNFFSRNWTIWDIEKVCECLEKYPEKKDKEIAEISLTKHTNSKKTAEQLVYDIRKKRKYVIVSQYYNF